MTEASSSARRPVRTRLARWGGSVALATVFGCVALGGYCHWLGLPRFLQSVFLSPLQARGVHLQFGRLRWAGLTEFLAEDVRLQGLPGRPGLRLRFLQGQFQLNLRDLTRGELPLKALDLSGGRLDAPLTSASPATPALVVTNLSLRITRAGPEAWRLTEARALWNGCSLRSQGILRHPFHWQSWNNWWNISRPHPSALSGRALAQFHRCVDFLRRTHFSQPPELEMSFLLDGLHPDQARLDLKLHLAGALRAANGLGSLALSVQVHPLARAAGQLEATGHGEARHLVWKHTHLGQAQLELHATLSAERRLLEDFQWRLDLAGLNDPALAADQLHLAGQTQRRPPSASSTFLTRLSTSAQNLRLPQSSAGHLSASAQIEHSGADRFSRGTWNANAQQIQTRWGRLAQFKAQGQVSPAPASPTLAATTLPGAWHYLAPIRCEWECRFGPWDGPRLAFKAGELRGRWKPPRLSLKQFSASLYGGQVQATGQLDVLSRDVTAEGNFDFDTHRLEPLLNQKTRRWLEQFGWAQPPAVSGSIRFHLPPWSQPLSAWPEVIKPSLVVHGKFASGPGTYRRIPITAAEGHFTRSNSVWTLPDLAVSRPEGQLQLQFTYDLPSKRYHWHVNGPFDPAALVPLLTDKTREVFQRFRFSRAPRFQAEVRGTMHNWDSVIFSGSVEAEHFQYQGEPIDEFSAFLDYTNRVLQATRVRARRKDEFARADALSLDLRTHTLRFTRLLARADPVQVSRLIGPKTAHALAPYHFLRPPLVQIDGKAVLHEPDRNDLHFQVSGGPFHYWRFRAPQVSAHIDWTTNRLVLTNLTAQFYQGQLAGHFNFQFATNHRSANFQFQTRFQKVNLARLLPDLAGTTNHVEGQLDGQITVTSANTRNLESWTGYGQAALQDGYLWDYPLFSIFSPMLDLIYPGLGSSRGGSGTAHFTFAQGRIRTDDLEMREPTLRLQYRGSVDLSGRIDAVVEAELLRDAWVVGPLVSLAFSPLTKFFEYHITGSLPHPSLEPEYLLPHVLLLPLQPLGWLQQLFLGSPTAPPSPGAPSTPEDRSSGKDHAPAP